MARVTESLRRLDDRVLPRDLRPSPRGLMLVPASAPAFGVMLNSHGSVQVRLVMATAVLLLSAAIYRGSVLGTIGALAVLNSVALLFSRPGAVTTADLIVVILMDALILLLLGLRVFIAGNAAPHRTRTSGE